MIRHLFTILIAAPLLAALERLAPLDLLPDTELDDELTPDQIEARRLMREGLEIEIREQADFKAWDAQMAEGATS